MSSLLNPKRPLFFCPGCGHDNVVRAVDGVMQDLGISGEELAIVTDIGCSGLFDTFFSCHAVHGLHGRALTYATGLKMVRPELHVIVIMGDGGLGIGGAHVLASCRRNLDITLLVLNNFNYGMTGGQCSSTTPTEEKSSSQFLGSLEKPLDICTVAAAAGADFAEKAMATDTGLKRRIAKAIGHSGFSMLDIWGLCPGRHLKRNPKTVSQLQVEMVESEASSRPRGNRKKKSTGMDRDYGTLYREAASHAPKPFPLKEIEVRTNNTPLIHKRCELLLLGAAGQYINTMGEIVGLAAMNCGLHVAQKNDYPITVLRGHSVAELVFDNSPIGYTGITKPKVIVCVAQEGINRRKKIFESINSETVVLAWPGLDIPPTAAKVEIFSPDGVKIRKKERGMALLARLAQMEICFTQLALENGIKNKYVGKLRDQSIDLIRKLSS